MKKVMAAGGVVFNQYGELLMICRRSKWDLPKGHLEKNETLESCALREVQEETGLKNISVVRFLGITQHEYFDNHIGEDAVKETHWFEMQADKNETLIPLLEESIEWARWVPKSEIKKYLQNSYDNIIELFSAIHF